MHITISHTNSIEEYSTAWDDFLPTGHHLSSKHLLGFEESAIEHITTAYVKVFFDGTLAGIIYMQHFSLNRKHINFTNSQTLLTKCVQAFLPNNLSILVCGHLFRIHYKGYYFKNNANEAYIFECIQMYIKQNKKPSGIIIKDADVMYSLPIYKKRGFRFFDADVTMEIARRAHWLTFNDYLADLKKKYLQRAKKIITSLEGIEQKELSAEEILQNSEVITYLYQQVVDKQTIKLGYVNAQYFYNLKMSLGSKFELIAMYKNKSIVGFYTFIYYDTQMETHFIGLNYEVNKTHNLYFNMLFLGIKKLIERGLDSLELGRTAKDAKVNVGATQSPIINYIKVKNYFAKIILDCILNLFKKTDTPTTIQRHPLKDMKPSL